MAAIRVLALIFVGYAILVFLLQRWVVFPGASRSSPRASPSEPAGVVQVWLEVSSGRVEAWMLPAERGVGADGSPAPEAAAGDAGGAGEAAPTVIFAHGNGELIEDWSPAMDRLAMRGINVLLVEYPGYGHSEGKPTRATIRETFVRAYDWLVQNGGTASSGAGAFEEIVDPDRIVAYGRSLGGGAVADLADDRPVAALILQSTFTSAASMARSMLVPPFLVRDRFSVRDVVERFSGPVLLMHGRADEVIPFRHAERLAEAQEGLEVTEIDCGHNDCLAVWPDIVDQVASFLERNGIL